MPLSRCPIALIVGGAAVAMATASVSYGSIHVAAVNLGPAQNNSGSVRAAGHSAWLIRLVADEGEKMTRIDLGPDASAAEGIFASPRGLGQRWGVDPDGGERTPTPVSDIRNNNNSFSVDSHFLITRGSVDVFPFSEDNDGVNRPGYPADTAIEDFGNGTAMHGIIDLLPTGQAHVIDLAYVVIEDIGGGRIIANVTTNRGEYPGLTGTFGIPAEPTTLSLVGLAGLGLLTRRRKT